MPFHGQYYHTYFTTFLLAKPKLSPCLLVRISPFLNATSDTLGIACGLWESLVTNPCRMQEGLMDKRLALNSFTIPSSDVGCWTTPTPLRRTVTPYDIAIASIVVLGKFGRHPLLAVGEKRGNRSAQLFYLLMKICIIMSKPLINSSLTN